MGECIAKRLVFVLALVGFPEVSICLFILMTALLFHIIVRVKLYVKNFQALRFGIIVDTYVCRDIDLLVGCLFRA